MRERLITDEEAATLAEVWAAPLKRGKSPKYSGLVDFAQRKFGKAITQRTAERAVRRAFECQHVSFQRSVIVPGYSRDKGIERALASQWQDFGVRKVIVVAPDDPDVSSDTIHNQLGFALADILDDAMPNPLSEDGCRIGLGSGRAIRGLVKGLLRFDPLQTRDVTLMSMTGSLFPNVNLEAGAFMTDADVNIQEFLPYFSRRISVQLLSSQIAYDLLEPELKKRWLRVVPDLYDADGVPLPEVDVANDIPTIAFMGIGALSNGHRLFDFVGAPETKPDTYFSSIKGALSEALEISRTIEDRYDMVPLADLCNRFFVCLPDEKHSDDDWLAKELGKLEHIIENQINPHLMTTPKTLIRKIPNNNMILGSKKKYQALNTIFRKGYVPLHTICLDIELAECFLR